MNFVLKNKMCKAFSVFLLIALAFTLVLPVGAETYPTEAYDTYTYWAGPDETYPVSTTPIYEYKDVITGDSLGVGAFNEPQDVYTDKNGNITEQCVGGRNCYQMVGISYWNAEAGAKLANDLEEVYRSPGGKERYWEQVALLYKKENYQVAIRECKAEDIVEIDSYSELKRIDPLYADK